MSAVKTVCAWCQAVIADGPLDEHGRVSHGICPKCWRLEQAEGAFDRATRAAREYAGKLGEHEARYAVAFYLRECRRRGVDPMAYLDSDELDPAFRAEE